MRFLHTYRKENYQPFFKKGRVFFAHFLSCFKKFTPLDSKPRGIVNIQRGKHPAGLNRKSGQFLKVKQRIGRFCICGKGGQGLLEYLILIAVVACIIAVAIYYTPIHQVREAGETIFEKAVNRISQ